MDHCERDNMVGSEPKVVIRGKDWTIDRYKDLKIALVNNCKVNKKNGVTTQETTLRLSIYSIPYSYI